MVEQYLEKLFRSIEPITVTPWFPYAMAFVGLLFGLSVFKSLKVLPNVAKYAILAATLGVLFMNWIYNRNEPAIFTPLVDIVAPWLPAATDTWQI